jgi:hypothetical protein
LHFLDLTVKIIDQVFGLALKLRLLVLKFDAHNLVVLFIKFSFHLLVSFTWWHSVEVGVDVVVSWLELGLAMVLVCCFFVGISLHGSSFIIFSFLLGLSLSTFAFLFFCSFLSSTVDLVLTVLINFRVSDVEELLGVLRFLINLGEEEIFSHAQNSVDLANTAIHLLNLRND